MSDVIKQKSYHERIMYHVQKHAGPLEELSKEDHRAVLSHLTILLEGRMVEDQVNQREALIKAQQDAARERAFSPAQQVQRQ
jgi:hypothetical protein